MADETTEALLVELRANLELLLFVEAADAVALLTLVAVELTVS